MLPKKLRVSARVALALACIVTFGAIPQPAEALTLKALPDNMVSYEVHGDFMVVGNGSLKATGNRSGYSADYLYAGYNNTAVANDTYNMVNYDSDSNANTFNSSSASFTIPSGAKVKSAKLVWSGNTGTYVGVRGNTCNGQNLATIPSTASNEQPVTVVMGSQTGTYNPNNYQNDIGKVSGSNPEYYSANADVTGLFKGFVGDGNPRTMTVGNVWGAQGYGCYAGWALQIIYDFERYDISATPNADGSNPSQLRAVYAFEGYARKFATDTEQTKITLNGLQPQGNGSRMGSIAFEGDASIGGDFVKYTDSTTTTPQALESPGSGDKNNYFQSVSDGSVPFNGQNTKFYNGSVSASSSALPWLVAGDSTMSLELGTAQDSYLVTNVVVSVPLADVKIMKTAKNGEQDQAIAPGATPSFRITVYNSGSVALTKLSVADQLVPQCMRTEAQISALIKQTFPQGNGFLPAGGSIQYTCDAPATSTAYDNSASVKGQTGTNIPVADSNVSKVLIAKWEVSKAPKYPDAPMGTPSTWVITVKNTGTADIFNVNVQDPTVPNCTKSVDQISAGSTYSYDCIGAILTGTQTNGITATGSGQATSASENKVPLTYKTDSPAVMQASAVNMEKTANKSAAGVKESVTYTFTIKNTGTSILNTLAVNDPEFPSCNKTISTPLAPGATTTYTCDAIPFTAQNSTAHVNHATVTATPPSGQVVTSSSEVTVGNKALKLTKSADTTDVNGNGVLDSGDTVKYSFSVLNTGSVTLTKVTVADPKVTGISCSPTTIAPGVTAKCTANPYTVTVADVNAGTLVNSATATSTAPDGTTTDGAAQVTLTPVQRPEIKMTKIASPKTIDKVGQVVTYTFTVSNTGNTTLAGVNPTDSLKDVSALACNIDGAAKTLPTSLDPGKNLLCTATRVTLQSDLNAGKVVNTATVAATSPKGTSVSANAIETVNAAQFPKATLEKTADAKTFGAVGQVVNYTLKAKNEGNVALTGVQINDGMPRLTNRVCTPAAPATLEPGREMVCTASLTVTQNDIDGGSIINTASLSATAPSGAAVPVDSKSWVIDPATKPGLALDKVASRVDYSAPDQTITYTLTVTNSGNTTINDVRVVDVMPGLVMGACSQDQGGKLIPGAKMSCTATYKVRQSDIDAGSLVNDAKATATDSHNTKLSDAKKVTIPAVRTDGIALSKTASPTTVTKVGDQVTYTFVTRNSGNTTLTNVKVADPLNGLSKVNCGNGTDTVASLAPGALATCTAARATTLADVNAGAISNTATVTASSPTGASPSATGTANVTVTQDPKFTVKKAASPLQITRAGEVVTYSITVENTGNVTMSSLAVTDPKVAALSCTPVAQGADLDPGKTTVCTGTYTATQTDVNAGSILNTAKATLTTPKGAAIAKEDSATVTTSRDPQLSVTKTGSVDRYSKVGDTIAYTITVTNSGNVTISNLTVTDPMFPASSPLTCTGGNATAFEPGQVRTCTGTRAIVQADIDNGTLTNTATAAGVSPTGTKVTNQGTFKATATQEPNAKLTKTANPSSITEAGKAISYTLVLSNTGNVTLSNAQITDPKLGTLSCSPALGSKLAPEASMTCTGTYTSTQNDVNAGSILNTAGSSVTPPTGAALTPTASETVTVNQKASLALTKTAAPERVTAVGQTVTYSFGVTNTGNVTIKNIAVTDTDLPGLSDITCPVTTLDPGKSTTCTATYVTKQIDLDQAAGKFVNKASVTGVDPKNVAVTPATAEATVTIAADPKLKVTKTAKPTAVKTLGEQVSYEIVVTNPGNVTVTNVQVVDSLITADKLTCSPALGSALAPNATMTCQATRAAIQSDLDAGKIVNTATTNGKAPDGSTVNADPAQAVVTVTQEPKITLKKTASLVEVDAAGQIVTYSYEVKNEGNVTLGSLKIVDPHDGLSAIDCRGVTSLAPNATATCTATYAVKQSDLNAGSVKDTATVRSEKPGGDSTVTADDITDTSSAVVPAKQKPSIAFTKALDTTSYSRVGQVLTYTFTLTNDGNVTLAAPKVSDTLAGLTNPVCTPANVTALEPKASLRCTATYTIAQKDLDAQSVVNSATGSATAPDGSVLTKTDSKVATADLKPAISLNKSVSPNPASKTGETVTYSFVVKNTGNVTLNNVAVKDPLPELSAVSCPVTTLAPDASTTCTATMKLTQAQADSGTVLNTATVSATDATGKEVTKTSSATLRISQDPKLTVDKSADVATVAKAGDIVNFTFVVKNEGNITISDIALTDRMINANAPMSCPQTSLAPAASMTCKAAYTVKQEDIDAGTFTNTATVNGKTASGAEVPEATDSVEIKAPAAPAWTFTKIADHDKVKKIGEVVEYTFTVVNTGNVTLRNVFFDDPRIDNAATGKKLDCEILNADGSKVPDLTSTKTLAPGRQKVCRGSRIFTQADFEVKDPNADTEGIDWPNQAVVNAKIPDGSAMPTLQSSPALGAPAGPTTVYLLPSPDFEMNKTASAQTYSRVGQVINYTIVARNSGNVDLNNVTITDKKLKATTFQCSPAMGSLLHPNETMTCSGAYTTTQADLDSGAIINEAAGHGTDNQGKDHDATSAAVLEVVYFGQTGLSLEKSATPRVATKAGETITYSFLVTNLGTAAINDLKITDPLKDLSAISCPTTVVSGSPDIDHPGQVTCTATYTVKQSDIDAKKIDNSAVATGNTLNAGKLVDLTGKASATVTANHAPSISLKKTANPRDGAVDTVGDIVDYSFLVTNTGNLVENSITVTDSMSGLSAPVCPRDSLKPGESMTCTAALTVSQSQLDQKQIPNRATVTATDIDGQTTATDSTAVSTVQKPSFTFEKKADISGYSKVGEVVTYTFVGTNTGNITLSNMVPSDVLAKRLSGMTCTPEPTTVRPGDKRTCTATLTVTQADIDAGSIVNKATMSPLDPAGSAIEPKTDTKVVTAEQKTGLTITKQLDKTTYSQVDETLRYSFTIKNSGNVSLANVQLHDELAGLKGITCSPALGSALAGGKEMTCSAEYAVTQPDLDATTIVNKAHATGAAPNSMGNAEVRSNDATQISTAVLKAEVDITKSASLAVTDKAGQEITYTFHLVNTGTATLSGLEVTDAFTTKVNSKSLNVTCPVTTLAPKASTDCTATYTVSQEDIDAGDPGLSNTATVTGRSADGQVVTDTARAVVQIDQNPQLAFDKSASLTSFNAVGQVIDYTFLVTNKGNVSITDIAVTDSLTGHGLSDLICPALANGKLDPAASTTCTANYTVTQDDLDATKVVNTASVVGKSPDGTATQPVTDNVEVPADLKPAMTLKKTPSVVTVNAVGTPIEYTLVLTNTGNVTITNSDIKDDVIGDNKLTKLGCQIRAVDGSTRDGLGLVSLKPGEVRTCRVQYNATQVDLDAGSIPNTAVATGATLKGAVDPVRDSALVETVTKPHMTLVKKAAPLRIQKAGDQVSYNFTILNDGTATLHGLTLTDTMSGLSAIKCEKDLAADLAPGKEIHCSATKVVTADEMNLPTLDNTATLKALDPKNKPVDPVSASATVTPVHIPKLQLDKSHNLAAVSKVDEVVTYTFTVTNIGNVKIEQIVLSDPMADLSLPVCQKAALDVKESTTCTATYKVKQTDLDRGHIDNSASVTGVDPVGGDPVIPGTDTDTVPVTSDPKLDLVKKAASTIPVKLGDMAAFTIVATNSGNVTLKNVRVDDDNPDLTSLTCTPAQGSSLAPGAVMTCQATIATGQDHVDKGSVPNTAKATATDPYDKPIAEKESSDKVLAAPGIASATLTKSAKPERVKQAGETVTFTIVLTNTGSYSLFAGEMVDKLIGAKPVQCDRELGKTSVAPGAVVTCTTTYVVQQADIDAGKIHNTAQFSSVVPPTYDDKNKYVLTADVDVLVDQSPKLELSKTADRMVVAKADDPVVYTLTLQNTGNVTVANATITDKLAGMGAYTCLKPDGSAATLPVTLAPGARVTCQSTRATTQTDIDAGSILNTASAAGTAPDNASVVSEPKSVLISAEQNPNLRITKKANKTLVQRVGEPIVYTITVENTGNLTLKNANVSDPMTFQAPLSCTPAQGSDLAPGKTMTCTATYLTVHADLEKGGITNTATFSSVKPNGDPMNGSDGTHVPALYNPKLSFEKTVAAPVNWKAGDFVTYTFRTKNTGNMDAWLPRVVDPMPDLSNQTCRFEATGAIFDGTNPLLPGKVLVCTATYQTKQIDVDRGFIANTAQIFANESNDKDAAGNPSGIPFPVEQSSARTETDQKPSISVKKSADKAIYKTVGEDITYSFGVTNTSYVTLSALTVVDPLPNLSAVSCPVASLDPGKSTICTATYKVTQKDIDRGRIDNSVTASAAGPHGDKATSAPATKTVNAEQNGKAEIAKTSASSQVSKAGDVIEFAIVARNTGNVTLMGTVVTDPGATITGCDRALPTDLAPDGIISCTATRAATQADIDGGAMANTAYINGATPAGVPVFEKSTATVPALQNPSIVLDKTVDRSIMDRAGETLTYTFKAKNTGNISLRNIVIKDPLPGLSALSCDHTVPATLIPDEVLTCTATYQVTQSDMDSGVRSNKATVSADRLSGDPNDPADDIVSSDDAVIKGARRSELSLVKATSSKSFSSRTDVLPYTFTVTNIGNLTLHDVVVQDPMTGQNMTAISCPKTKLAPQEVMVCTASLSPVQIDLDRGNLLNTATVHGVDPFGMPATPAESSVDIVAEQQPAMSLTKQADHTMVTYAGERVQYTFVGKNNGNVTLSVVKINDPMPRLEPLDCYPRLPAQLPPGDSVVCRAYYTVTQEDLDGLAVDNTATMTALDPKGNPVDPKNATETIETVIKPDLVVEKTANVVEVTRAGEKINYTFMVNNKSNVAVSDVWPTDPLPGLGKIVCGTDEKTTPFSMRAGESIECHAEYITTVADMNLSSIDNTVIVNAKMPNGDPVKATDALTIPVKAVPNVELTKSASPDKVAAAGDIVTYTMTLTNTGAVELNNAAITDQLQGLSALSCANGVGPTGIHLNPGESTTCTATLEMTQSHIDGGVIKNTALMSGTYGNGAPASANGNTEVTPQHHPDFLLEKVADVTSVKAPGDPIEWTITFTNTGNVTGYPTITDELLGTDPLVCLDEDGNDFAGNMPVAPGKKVTCKTKYAVVQNDLDAGAAINTVTAKVRVDSQATPVEPPPATAVVPAEMDPKVEVEKLAQIVDMNANSLADIGETVNWTIIVRNTGNVTMKNLRVADPMLSNLTCLPNETFLPPGETMKCVGSKMITTEQATGEKLSNTAVVSADQLAKPVTAVATIGTGKKPMPRRVPLPHTGSSMSNTESQRSGNRMISLWKMYGYRRGDEES
ncbi:MAG: DUF7507 domain-containing protein [Propionibacteriaceae bacterium]